MWHKCNLTSKLLLWKQNQSYGEARLLVFHSHLHNNLTSFYSNIRFCSSRKATKNTDYCLARRNILVFSCAKPYFVRSATLKNLETSNCNVTLLVAVLASHAWSGWAICNPVPNPKVRVWRITKTILKCFIKRITFRLNMSLLNRQDFSNKYKFIFLSNTDVFESQRHSILIRIH